MGRMSRLSAMQRDKLIRTTTLEESDGDDGDGDDGNCKTKCEKGVDIFSVFFSKSFLFWRNLFIYCGGFRKTDIYGIFSFFDYVLLKRFH
jgi:hypothetical protein